MAWRQGRKRAQNSRQDSRSGSSLDVRLTPADRTGGPVKTRADPERRRRESSPPRPPKKRKTGSKSRSGFGRIIYWGFVLLLWGLIAGIGALVWIGAHLPPIESLE